jgi:hypothetical protein
MVTHCVFLKIRPDAAPAVVEAGFQALAALMGQVEGLTGYRWGPNVSSEGLSRGYTHGFVMTFDTPAARDAYLPHPGHQAAAAQLVAVTEGGVEGIVVLDFET